MVLCVVWQASGCWNRGQECVWDEGGNSQQLNQLGYPGASATPKSVGGEAGKTFSACWGNESLTGGMYLCDEESLTYPWKTGTAVLIKGNRNTLSWKKKKNICIWKEQIFGAEALLWFCSVGVSLPMSIQDVPTSSCSFLLHCVGCTESFYDFPDVLLE